MRSGTIALLAGTVALFQLPQVPALGWLTVLPVSLLLWWRFRHWFWRLLTFFLFGFALAAIQAQSILGDRLPSQLEGQELTVVGVIDTLPEARPHAWRFVFHVEDLVKGSRAYAHPDRIRLSWYGKVPEPLHAGDRWRLQVRLKSPHGFQNPGGFDYEKWLFEQRIGATGYVRHPEQAALLPRHWYDAPLQRVRQKLRDRLQDYLGEDPLGAIVLALGVGDRSHISEAQWSVLRNTGTAHLVAISGLHVGLLAGLAFWVFNLLWRIHPRLMLWQAAPRVAALMALITAMLYAALAGFSLPTQRALIMVAVVLLAVMGQQRVRPSHTLALALLVVLLYDPTAVLSAGFWLSFGAVLIILYLFAGRQPRPARWRQWGRLQCGVSVGLAPLLLMLFQQTSLVAPLANLVAVPLVSLVVVPVTLLLVVLSLVASGLSQVLASALVAGLAPLWALLQWLQSPAWATLSAPAPTLPVLVLALVGIGILLAPRGVPHRYLGLMLCVPLLFPGSPGPQPGGCLVTVLDVGQGLAAVVQTAHHVLVFDTGPRFSSGFNTGDAVVLPFLRQRGITRVDTLILSHADIDHRGGARAVVRGTTVRRVVSSYPLHLPGITGTRCLAGEHWRWDGVRFEILNPSRHGQQSLSSENNASCVLRVQSGHHGALFTADIETPAETYLVANQARKLKADVLVVPHHGSKTSSSAAFVNTVNPDYAIVPAGYHNRFGFPHDRVRARYVRRGIPLLQTGELGAIEFSLTPQGMSARPVGYRHRARRLWR